MPTYDYICDACGHEFEAFESMKVDPQTICPTCHEARLRRKIGPGAAILFKGSGFYQTDFIGAALTTRRGPRPTSRPAPPPSRPESKGADTSESTNGTSSPPPPPKVETPKAPSSGTT